MKKCLLMFALLIIALIMAILSDSDKDIIKNDILIAGDHNANISLLENN